jgi:porin
MNPRFRIGRASGLAPYDDKIAIGGWYYTAKFNDLSEAGPNGLPAQHRGSGGAYLIGDRLLFQTQDDPAKRVTAFLQAGIGDERVDRFGSYVGSEIAATGFIASRPNDEMGLAVAAARNGSHYENSQRQQGAAVNDSEIALDLTYLTQIADWLAMQPDAQYVMHPNTNSSLKNALVFQFRVEMSF